MAKIEFVSKWSRKKVGYVLRKNWGIWKQPPKIEVLDGGPIPSWQVEPLKNLIRKAVLRKLGQPQEEINSTSHPTSIQINLERREQHIIHKAMKWKKMLETGEFKSQSEIARGEGLSRARVTQIMNLLKLSVEWKEFLIQLNDYEEICKYSERRLRNYRLDRDPCTLCPIKKNVHC